MDDFVVFYAAGRLARRDTSDLYDLEAIHAEQAEILDAEPSELIRLPFFNPPPYVVPFAALSVFELETAAAIWTLTGSLTLALSILLVLRRSQQRDQVLLVAAAAVVVSMPFHEVILHGQVTLFLFAAWVAIYLGVVDGDRPWLAASGLLVLAIKPQLVVVPLAYLLLSRQIGPLWRFGVLELGLIAGSVWVLGGNVYLSWMGLMVEALAWEDSNGIWTHGMFGWNSFVRVLIGPEGHGLRGVLSWSLVVGTSVLVAVEWRRGLPPANLLATMVLSSLLISPHLYAQDLMLAGLPVLALIGSSRNRAIWAGYGLIGWALTYVHFSVLLPAPDGHGVNFVTLWLAAGVVLAAMPTGKPQLLSESELSTVRKRRPQALSSSNESGLA